MAVPAYGTRHRKQLAGDRRFGDRRTVVRDSDRRRSADHSGHALVRHGGRSGWRFADDAAADQRAVDGHAWALVPEARADGGGAGRGGLRSGQRVIGYRFGLLNDETYRSIRSNELVGRGP